MNIHEYQAKEVLKGFGVPVPKGFAAFNVDDAVRAAELLGAIDTDAARTALLRHRWNGNVRELQNRIQRALLTHRGAAIDVSDLDLDAASPVPGRLDSPIPSSGPLADERRRIEHALTKADGVVARAADQLGLSRQALYRKMNKLGIVLERRPRT